MSDAITATPIAAITMGMQERDNVAVVGTDGCLAACVLL